HVVEKVGEARHLLGRRRADALTDTEINELEDVIAAAPAAVFCNNGRLSRSSTIAAAKRQGGRIFTATAAVFAQIIGADPADLVSAFGRREQANADRALRW